MIPGTEGLPTQIRPSPSPNWAHQKPKAPSKVEVPHLRDYWNVVLKRKWLVLTVLVTVVVGTAVQTMTTTKVYRSTARVRIDPESTNILPYEDVYQAADQGIAMETYLQTQFKILQGRTLAERIVKQLQLHENPSFNAETSGGLLTDSLAGLIGGTIALLKGRQPETPDSAENRLDKDEADLSADVDRFLGSLQVQPIRGSRLVEVSYASHDARLAATIVNTLADQFIEMNFESRYQATTKATEFLQKQMHELKVKVEKSEEQLVAYARAHNILSLAGSSSKEGDRSQNIIMQKLADLNQEMTKVEAQMIERSAEFDAVKNATVQDFPDALVTDNIRQLETTLADLEQKLANMTSHYGPVWPEVVQLKREVNEVNTQLVREKKRAIQRARAQYQVAVDRRNRLQTALVAQKEMADQLNENSIQYNILQREVETNKQLYEGLLQRLKEAGVAAGLKSSNINVVDRGETPRRVYRPRTAINLALGLILGLMLGVSMAFFIDYLDNTIKTPDDIEKTLDLPSLGVIPAFKMFETPVGTRLLTAASTQSTDASVDAVLQGSQDMRSRVWEAYRSLRTSLLLSNSGKPPQIILVTSALPAEGKTTTALNAAIVLAQTSARTLLIDLDMRRPKIGSHFGLNGHQGMSYFLTGNSDLTSQVRKTSVPNLFVVSAGYVPPNPAELIGSDRMDKALKLLRDYFQYVVIDSPPILSVTDALVLSPKVDGVVMVVRGGETPREAVRRASEHLNQVGAKILGVMINDVDIRKSEYRYYYKYYYDSKYYSGYGYGGDKEDAGKS